MSLSEENVSNDGIDSNDQQVLSLHCLIVINANCTQPVFIFTPHEEADRPPKRRRVDHISIKSKRQDASVFRFEPLLGGLETSECVQLRMELYDQLWGATENRIQVRSGNGSKKSIYY